MPEEKLTKEEVLGFFKDEGLDLAEDVVVSAVRGSMKLIRAAVKKFSTGLGIIIDPMIDYVEKLVLTQVDKIDGEDDPEY